MPNARDLSKPWNQVLSVNVRSWIAAGNAENIHGSLREELRDNNFQLLDAMIVVQDCNMGGQYYRYFWYKNGENKRYCEIGSRWYFNTEVGVDKMEIGSTVKLCDSKDLAVHEGTGNDYVKLLLPLE